MREIAPDYYTSFRCIADKCRHSCCIGWEIDVDEDSLAAYASLPGTLGEEIRSNIVTEDGCAHFRLLEGDRCPFLNEQGLCRMILGFGEDILCQICSDHPRFRSEFSHCTEIGLGLSCEAAAKLILTQPEPMQLAILSDDGEAGEPEEYEAYLLALRQQYFSLLTDKTWNIEERLENILDLCGTSLPEKTWPEWAEVYRSLERLDPVWDAVLDTLSSPTKPLGTAWDPPFRNLAAYFLYRHIPAALYDGEEIARTAFSVLSVLVIRRLFAAADTQSIETLTELCRIYSAEIEYSTENTDALIELLASE